MTTQNMVNGLLAFIAVLMLCAAAPVSADRDRSGSSYDGGRSYSSNDRDDDRRRYDKKYSKRDHRRYDDRRYRDGRWDDRYRDRGYYGGRYFVDRHRHSVRDYYRKQYRKGRCPRGLVRRGGICVAPVYSRGWVVGSPLPRNVVYYDVPPPVISYLGYPPPGYRYVRVASDILLIAIGTGLVMDAIYDLGGY